MSKHAIVLLSGGIDSATVLALAKEQGYTLYALSVDYGQRHRAELDAAKTLANQYAVEEHVVIPVGLSPLGQSALLDTSIDVPNFTEENCQNINASYVPARNTILLSLALGLAETRQANHIFFGGCLADRDAFPDCRPTYIDAFENMANLATESGVKGNKLTIERPLINLSKAETLLLGTKLGVDYSKTVTCYQADEQGHACGHCLSCGTRKQGFSEAGIEDVTPYKDK